MKKSVRHTIFVLMIAFAIVLAGCAGPSPTEPPQSSEPTSPPVVETAQPTEAIEVTEEVVTPETAMTEEPTAVPEVEKLTFGMLMVGPYNDHGWSETHYNAGKYIEANVENTEFVYVDKVNPADRPGTTTEQLAEELIDKGATVLFFTSDDMKDAAETVAQAYPDLYVVHVSGDTVWKDGQNYVDLKNFKNVMGKMELGLMIGGCAAALSTESGKIGHVGPLIAPITLRAVSSAYLGAKYCWTKYRQEDPMDLQYKVTWIGFWFNIPGVTADPSQVSDDFINDGYDVLISGLDTTEALVQTQKAAAAGKQAWAVAYEDTGACSQAPEVCLGVPTFSWIPSYTSILEDVRSGSYEQSWEWVGPEWADINNIEKSWIGFTNGGALSPEAAAELDKFIAELAGGLNLWTGPLNYQDGSAFLSEGQEATDQEIWYLPTLLEGIEGQSVSQ